MGFYSSLRPQAHPRRIFLMFISQIKEFYLHLDYYKLLT
jgi:hypothetical protein